MNTPKYKIENQKGEWFGIFDSQEEAEKALPYMSEKYLWRVINYIPLDEEVNKFNENI